MVCPFVVGTSGGPHRGLDATANTGQHPPGMHGNVVAMTRPTSRVLALLEILQTGGTRPASDLAGRLEQWASARRGA